jgi:hypothetical protein
MDNNPKRPNQGQQDQQGQEKKGGFGQNRPGQPQHGYGQQKNPQGQPPKSNQR